jgi:hypothetical protein
MNPLEKLKSVLCDPEGKCCITGSDEDRAIVDRALQALAQPEQEPVAADLEVCRPNGPWQRYNLYSSVAVAEDAMRRIKGAPIEVRVLPLYTTPPKRPWVGLTDEQRNYCVETPFVSQQWANIEAKLKELNA